MFKNVASQKIAFYAHDATNNVPKTGDAANITAYVSKDGAAAAALADTSATELDATNAKGIYFFDVAQSESNGDILVFSAKSSTSGIQIDPLIVFTVPANFTTLSIDSNGRVDLAKIAGTAQTARDIGASVLIAAASVQAIWDALTSALTTSGSIGKLLGDNINATIGSRASQTSVDTVASYIDTEVATIVSQTTAAAIRTALGLTSNNLDAQLDALPTNAELATALGTADDAVLAAIAALSIPTAAQNAAALLDAADGVETNRTVRHALRLMLAALVGKLSGAATTTVAIRDTNDTKNRISATVDADGNRSAVTLDGT